MSNKINEIVKTVLWQGQSERKKLLKIKVQMVYLREMARFKMLEELLMKMMMRKKKMERKLQQMQQTLSPPVLGW